MTARRLLPTQAITQKGDLPSRDLVEVIQRLVSAVGAGGGGAVSDGDYGDVIVSGAGTVWTIEAAALNAAADARIAAASIGDLADVTLTAPATNDVLTFDGAAWVNTPAASGGGSPIMAWLI